MSVSVHYSSKVHQDIWSSCCAIHCTFTLFSHFDSLWYNLDLSREQHAAFSKISFLSGFSWPNHALCPYAQGFRRGDARLALYMPPAASLAHPQTPVLIASSYPLSTTMDPSCRRRPPIATGHGLGESGQAPRQNPRTDLLHSATPKFEVGLDFSPPSCVRIISLIRYIDSWGSLSSSRLMSPELTSKPEKLSPLKTAGMNLH